MGLEKNFIIYRIFYTGDMLAYVGKTMQDLTKRMYQHYFKDTDLDYRATKRIQFAYCNSMADMNVYEMYYINKLHPFENRDGISKDTLSIRLDKELEFQDYDISILDKYLKSDKVVINRSTIIPKNKMEWENKNFNDMF